MSDEKLDALLEAVAENTTTLIDVQQQAAATSASTKDARTYVQKIAKQTSWETNSRAIAATMTAALEKDHTALHAASRAAQEMQGISIEMMSRAGNAAQSQTDASNKFHFAADRLLKATEAREQGKWRRMGMIALIGALCGAVGFFAREPASKFDHLWEARNELKQDVTSSECRTLGGVNLMVDGARACVVKQDPS
jgi:hypothetical protein